MVASLSEKSRIEGRRRKKRTQKKEHKKKNTKIEKKNKKKKQLKKKKKSKFHSKVSASIFQMLLIIIFFVARLSFSHLPTHQHSSHMKIPPFKFKQMHHGTHFMHGHDFVPRQRCNHCIAYGRKILLGFFPTI